VFFSSDTSVTENMTHRPLGEICGSLTRFNAIRSAKVMGRRAVVVCCAEAAPISIHPDETTSTAEATQSPKHFIAPV